MSTPRKELPFPLSKCMNSEDILVLEEERRTILSYDAMVGQHEARWWEYSMAHRAIQEWDHTDGFLGGGRPAPLLLADVGGAGSRFAHSLVAQTSEDILLIDPHTGPEVIEECGRLAPVPLTVEQYAATAVHGQLDCLTAISVIEHVENYRPFLRACHMLLKPGGLLFLTTDCWNKEGPDVAHFHWMRKRIYNPESLGKLAMSCRELGFKSFGRTDWTYHGDTVYDYAFASLAMVKR